MDILNRERLPKEKLLRLVLVHGVVTPDPDFDKPGRGVYIRKDPKAFETALAKSLFNRAFHRPLTQEEIIAVREAL